MTTDTSTVTLARIREELRWAIEAMDSETRAKLLEAMKHYDRS